MSQLIKYAYYIEALVFIHSNLNARYTTRIFTTGINHKEMGNDLEIKCVSYDLNKLQYNKIME